MAVHGEGQRDRGATDRESGSSSADLRIVQGWMLWQKAEAALPTTRLTPIPPQSLA